LRITPQSHSLIYSFTDPATPDIYTLSLHDALPICQDAQLRTAFLKEAEENIKNEDPGEREWTESILTCLNASGDATGYVKREYRSEEHTSELQSQSNLVCRLLLEKKKNKKHKL